MSIRTAILGEVRLFREGLAELLRQSPGVEVVSTAGSLAEAVAAIERERPDVLLLDTAMADCLAHIRALTASFPDLKIVAVAVPETTSAVIACAEAGVAGYVPTDATASDLLGAIEAAARGELRCSARIAATLLRRVAELSQVNARSAAVSLLSRRELDVLRLLEAGRTNKEIARELGIELATTKNHVHSILEKLAVRGRTQAVVLAANRLPRRLGADAESRVSLQ